MKWLKVIDSGDVRYKPLYIDRVEPEPEDNTEFWREYVLQIYYPWAYYGGDGYRFDIEFVEDKDVPPEIILELYGDLNNSFDNHRKKIELLKPLVVAIDSWGEKDEEKHD